jgi:small-conductance mechanosensitive channel
MSNTIPSLPEIIARQLLFLNRANVQHQLLMIFLSLMLGWLLSKWFWSWLQKRFPQTLIFDWNDETLPARQYLIVLLQPLYFPVISLILLALSQQIFLSQDWIRGLIKVAIDVLWIYLVYRCLLSALYSTFPREIISKYHYRLFAPLLGLFILRTIINLYNNIEDIAQVSPFYLFNIPITLRSIFILLVAPYFLVVTVILLENTILAINDLKGQPVQGDIQASLLLARYFFIVLGIILILGYVGVNGTAIAAITGGLSVGIGFGLQQVVSNFVSGILLLFEKVLKPGDIINIEGQTSQVKKLGIRATTVQILTDNSEKIIPNQKFFTEDVTTYTGSDNLIYCSIIVGVGYNSNARQVMNLLLEIAHQHPRILENPQPVAFFLNFGDSSLNFELKFWLDNVNSRKRVVSDINFIILDQFTTHGIEIPFPQQDIHIRKD